VRMPLAVLVGAVAVAAAWPAAGGAANECRGITTCIPVTGPWVLVTRAAPAQYLLSCPGGRSVVGGLDAVSTSSFVHVEFAGRVGAPVSPGVTTARNALFRAILVGTSRRAAFQPSIGCIPTSGGGGRATVSARVTRPGAPVERFAKNVTVRPGTAGVGVGAGPRGETRTGAWTTIYFKTKAPPKLAQAGLVQVQRVVSGNRVGVTAAATDLLSPDAHVGVQVGVECAP
jgi:hypothetical protein